MDDEPDQDEDYTGPVCGKCNQPVGPLSGHETSFGWLCDACAAAQERESDRKMEERE